MDAGEYFPFAFGDELPAEQSADDARSLCFDSERMEQGVDIVGAPDVQLRLSADKPSGHLTVRLLDVRPDGSSALITYGVLNLTHRNSHQAPQALVANEVFDVSLALDHIAYRLPAGHRLRMALSTANWPTLWPSPEAVTLTIAQASLLLPVRPDSDQVDEWVFEAPEGAPAWQAEVLRASDYSRVTETDDNTGVVTTRIFSDFGENKDLQHDLISGGWVREAWSIHPDDPLSANVSIQWQARGGREGAMWQTEVDTMMWSDQNTFYFTGQLTAFENGQQVFSKAYSDEIPRALV